MLTKGEERNIKKHLQGVQIMMRVFGLVVLRGDKFVATNGSQVYMAEGHKPCHECRQACDGGYFHKAEQPMEFSIPLVFANYPKKFLPIIGLSEEVAKRRIEIISIPWEHEAYPGEVPEQAWETWDKCNAG